MLKFRTFIVSFLVLLSLVFLSACSAGQNSKGLSKPAQPALGGKDVKITQQSDLPKEALFVCRYTTNQVGVIDLATGETVKEIPVGAKPIALIKSSDNRYVYVANSGSGDVYMINTTTGAIEAKISTGNQPVAMAINGAGDKLYVLDYYFNRVSVVDLKLRSLVGFYGLNTYGFQDRIEPPDCCSDFFGEPLGAGRKPSAIVLDEAAGKIYVGNLGTWDVAVIDLEEKKEVNAFDATFGINDMLLAGPENNLYISAAGNEVEINDSILTLDMKGGGRIDKLKVGGKPVSMALSPDGRIIYVITQKDAQLKALNVANGEIIAQCPLGGEPGDVTLSKDGSKAYVANVLDGTVLIVDIHTYSVIKTIKAGVTPKALVYIN